MGCTLLVGRREVSAFGVARIGSRADARFCGGAEVSVWVYSRPASTIITVYHWTATELRRSLLKKNWRAFLMGVRSRRHRLQRAVTSGPEYLQGDSIDADIHLHAGSLGGILSRPLEKCWFGILRLT